MQAHGLSPFSLHASAIPLLLAAALACEPPDDDSADTAAEIEPLLELDLSPAEPFTGDALLVAVEHDEGVYDLSYAWYRDNLQVTELAGALVASEHTARDQVWRVVVTPERAQAADQAVSAKVTILNTPPAVSSLALSASPTVTTDIIAEVEAEDDDGDGIEYTWAWSVDGAVIEGAWGGSLPAGLFLRDQVVSVQVTPSDGTDDGQPASAEVTVGNSPPSLASASLGVSSAAVGTTLQVSTSGWYDADGDAEGYRYAWYVDEVEVAKGSDSYNLDGAVPGSVCWCQVTPWDGQDEGQPVLTELVVVVEDSP